MINNTIKCFIRLWIEIIFNMRIHSPADELECKTLKCLEQYCKIRYKLIKNEGYIVETQVVRKAIKSAVRYVNTHYGLQLDAVVEAQIFTPLFKQLLLTTNKDVVQGITEEYFNYGFYKD